MAKTKEPKTSNKTKSKVKPLSIVKNASVTKPSQTPKAQSKQVAKTVAVKATNGKRPKKAATPPSDSESDDSSASDASESASESESESEVENKPVATTNGNGKIAKKEVDTSDSSDSSASDSEASDSDSSDDEKAAASDSDGSDSSDSGEEAAPIAVTKNAVEETVEARKAAVNGAAMAVAKATVSSDEEDDSDDSASADDDDEEDEKASDDSDDSDESEEDAPSKKRKAEDAPVASAKKSKKETPAGGEDTGSKNLFVGNLSWNIDDEWLYREFEEFGKISGARVISDKATGRSKGFGYVEFINSADAAAALKAKKGALIDGREANVDFSTPRDNTAPKERANARAQSFGDSKNPESDTLFVGNLSFEADENMVGKAFGAHGTVTNVRLPTDMESGSLKGFGYVSFSSVGDAKAAFDAMVGAELGGRPLRLDYATPRPERNGGDSRGGGRGGGRGGRGGFGDRGGRGGRGGGRGGRGGFSDRGGRGGSRSGRGGSTNRGGFGDFAGKKQTFS